MTKASNARAAKRNVRAKIETATNGKNTDWNEEKSLAYAGELGASKGKGDISLATLAIHLVKMADQGILNSKGDHAKGHQNAFSKRRNGEAVGEKPGDATKVSQLKNFLKLGELGGKVNGEGLLARTLVALTKAREPKIQLGQPRPKQTFVAYLDVAKAQIEAGNGAELSADQIATLVMTKASKVATAKSLATDALVLIVRAANMTGSPKSLADLGETLKGIAKKLK